MALDHDDRTLLGLVVAPLTTVPTVGIVAKLSGASVSWNDVLWNGHVALFGLPLAYLVEALLVVALRVAGRSPRLFSDGAVIALGTLAGALVASPLAWEPWPDSLVGVGTGAVMGCVAAIVFVLIRGVGKYRAVAS